jgi:hypothetical protein
MDLSRLNRRRRESAEDHLYFFTGVDSQCVRFWFKDIGKVAKMIHADEYVCLKQAVGLLIYEAERWYQEHQHILMTWSTFKQSMIAQFDTSPLEPSIITQAISVERKNQPIEPVSQLDRNPLEPNPIEPNTIERNPNSVEPNPLEPDPTEPNLLEPNTIASHPLTSRPNPLIVFYRIEYGRKET